MQSGNSQSVTARSSDVHRRIVSCLGQAQAVGIEKMVDHTGLSKPVLRDALNELQDQGIVDILKPVEAQAFDRHTFVRLIRPTDERYLWEQELETPRILPLWRMQSLIRMDEPLRRRPRRRAWPSMVSPAVAAG